MTVFTGGVTPGFSPNSDPNAITVDPHGNIWFDEFAGRVARLTPDNGTVTEFASPSESHPLYGITAGPDGNIWYTTNDTHKLGRLNPNNGSITEFSPGMTPGFSANAAPLEITAGRDGNLWFSGTLSRVNLNNGPITVTEFGHGTGIGITVGPDGNIWFAQSAGVARLNPNGTVSEFSNVPGLGGGTAEGVTAGPDGNVWFAKNDVNPALIGRLNANGTATPFPYGDYNSEPEGITTGCDGNIWFSDLGAGVGRLNPDGTVTEFKGGTTPGLTGNTNSRRLTPGPDGTIWFTATAAPGRVVRLTSPPGAATGPAAGVSWRNATLTGVVHPCSQPTTYSFQYGSSTAYGSQTTAVNLTVGNQSTANLSRLAPNTLYHYRLLATNHSGTGYGADQTFRTPELRVGGLGVHPQAFGAEPSGPSAIGAKKQTHVHRGTTVKFTLTQAETVRFTVTKQSSGRKAKRGVKTICVKPTRKTSAHKRCKRTVTLKGSFIINGVAGKNSFHFTGRLNRKELAPGRYSLVATPIIAGKAGKATSTPIRIIR